MFAILNKYINTLRQKVILMFARALITGVNEDGGLQVVQVNLGNDDIIDSVERIQNFGFTSFPVEGSEAILLCIGGDRENPLVIASDSSEHRVKLSEGETALYNAFNRIVKLKNGDIQIGIDTFKKLINEAFKAMFNNHLHYYNDNIAGTPVPTVTSKPCGITGTGVVASPGIATPVPPPTFVLGNSEMTTTLKAE